MSDVLVIDASPEQRTAIEGVKTALADSPPKKFAFLVSPDGSSLPLPEPLYRVLVQAAATLVSGYQVVMAPVQRQLTTQEAADLSTSRDRISCVSSTAV